MSSRKGLYKGYILHNSGADFYIIDSEVGRGSSCIVYDGFFTDALNLRHQVRIKECYPINIKLKRNASGELISEDDANFEWEKKRFVKTYQDNVSFRFSEGFTNSSSNVTSILELNNTLYIVIDYQEGVTYDRIIETNLPDLIKTILSIAKLIQKYHDNDYLYLDLKPTNVLILPESREQVVLFDFDSLWHINKDNDFSRISYSEGFSAPEQCKGHSSKIGKQSDVYAVGVLLYYKLFNQLPTINDTLTGAIYDYSRIDKIDINTYSSLVQEYLTLFFRKTMASSIHVRWNNMVPVIDLLKRILQATTISVVMKNFLVEYTSSKARFNLEIAEKELDDLNCETEWQYMQTMDQVVFQKISEFIEPNSKLVSDYYQQYFNIFNEIEKFFLELIEEEKISQEIQSMVIKSRKEHLHYMDKHINLKEFSLIRIQVQREKPLKQVHLDLTKKDTLWTTLFGKTETRYGLSLDSRMHVISQIEKITNYNEELIYTNYVNTIKALFDQINTRINETDVLQSSCASTMYSEAIRMIYSNNEKLYKKGLLLLFDNYKAGNIEQSISEINKRLPILDGEFLGIAGNKILFLQQREDRNSGARLLFKSKSIDGTEKLLYEKKTSFIEKNITCRVPVLEKEPFIYVLFEDDDGLKLYCYDSENDLFEKKAVSTDSYIYGELFLKKKSEKEILWGKYNYYDESKSIKLCFSECSD